MYIEKPRDYYEGHEAIRGYWEKRIVGKQSNLEFRHIIDDLIVDPENAYSFPSW